MRHVRIRRAAGSGKTRCRTRSMNVRTAPGSHRAVPNGKDMVDRRDGMDAHGEDDRHGASVFGQEAVAEEARGCCGPCRGFRATSGGMFSESNPVGEGTATWKGAMVGESGDNFLSGDSTLVYDFSAATVDVRMSGIRDWNTPQTYPDIVWNGLDVRNGTFTDVNTIRGSFYGPNHEEVGGVFDGTIDRHHITGAFGAKRED